MATPKATLRDDIEMSMQRVADEQELDISFRSGRRNTDVILATMRGQRRSMLALALHVSENFPDVDLELVNIDTKSEIKTLMLAVAEKLEHQQTQVPERRAVLESYLRRALADE
ncbi:MAG: hypothetical protein AAF267_17460 [Deinococcota bacterium]